MRARLLGLAFAVGLAAIPAAQAKFRVLLTLTPAKPENGRVVRAVVSADSAQDKDCWMRLVAVAPGVDKYEVLAALGQPGGLARRLGFPVPLTPTGSARWRGTLSFPRAGRWLLVVPNWCAPGYALHPPVVRSVTVTARR